MRKLNLISGVIWLILSIFIFYKSIHLEIGKFYSPGAGLFPFLTGIFFGLLSVVFIFETLWRKPAAEEEKRIWAIDINWKKIILTLLIMIIYSLLLERLGYLLATFALMLFLFKHIGPERWPVAIISSIITVTLSYMIFGIWLQVQLPEGLLIRMIK